MRSGLKLRTDPKECCNPECSNVFTPRSNAQKWCPDCKQNGARRRFLARKSSNARKGRKCRWCQITDEHSVFHLKHECSGCSTQGGKNGRCKKHRGRPKNLRKGKPVCLKCEPDVPRHDHLPITLVCGRKRRVIHRSEGATFLDPSGNFPRMRRIVWLKHHHINDGDYVFLVDEYSYRRGITKHPLAVKGLPKWDELMGTDVVTADKFTNFLVDVRHFVILGEADPMTFGWFWQKFHPTSCERNVKRAWDRFKKKLRDSGVIFDVVVDEDTGGLGIRLDPAVLQSLITIRTEVKNKAKKEGKGRLAMSEADATLKIGAQGLPRVTETGRNEQHDQYRAESA